MLAEDIADKIQTESLGTVGTDIFIGELPFDKNDSVAVLYSPSAQPNQVLHYYSQAVDIRGRFSKYEEGRQKMQDIMDVFHRTQNYELGDYYVYISFANSMIQDNDRDLERRHLFQLSLTFVYRLVDEMS